MNTYQINLLARSMSAVLGLALMTPLAHADPRDNIVFDPATGNYTITYANPGNTTVYRMLFIPATKIDPSVRSSFRRADNMSIVYRYQVKSGKASKQYLEGIYIDPASNIVADRPLPLSLSEDINKSDAEMQADIDAGQKAVAHPSSWDGIALPSQGYGLRISWNTINSNISSGLPPGGSLSGLGFTSLDLPGIGDMQFKGYVSWTEFAGYDDDEMLEPTSEVGKKLTQLEKHDFVLRNAAVPTIAVPSPFDAAILLDRIQTQMHSWIGMQLLDASFSSQLDRYLVAAADAYRRNQPKAAKDDIETVREMLKKEYEDLGRDEEHESEKSQEKNDDKKSAMIARLAAQVLDFDLKYVIKRVGGDKDD